MLVGVWGGFFGGGLPFSRAWTLREVRVIRIRWILGPSPNSPFSGLLYDIFAEKVTKRLLESRLLRVAMWLLVVIFFDGVVIGEFWVWFGCVCGRVSPWTVDTRIDARRAAE